MNKTGTLLTTALLTLGIAAAAMAADPSRPDAPTIGPKEDQRAVDTSPPASAGKSTTGHKHKKKHKPATPAPATSQ